MAESEGNGTTVTVCIIPCRGVQYILQCPETGTLVGDAHFTATGVTTDGATHRMPCRKVFLLLAPIEGFAIGNHLTDTGIAYLIHFMVRSAVHADGYGVVLLPRGLAVHIGRGTGGRVRGGEPIHAGGERHGIFTVRQGDAVVRHIAARGGHQAGKGRHRQMSEWI